MFQGSTAPDTTVDSFPHLQGRGSVDVLNRILSEAPSNILHTPVYVTHWLVSHSGHSALCEHTSQWGPLQLQKTTAMTTKLWGQRQSWRRSIHCLRERQASGVYILNTTETKANVQTFLQKVVGTEKDKKQTSDHPRKGWGGFPGELTLSINELDERSGTCGTLQQQIKGGEGQGQRHWLRSDPWVSREFHVHSVEPGPKEQDKGN